MEDILVERNFDEPIDFDNFEGLAQKAPWCIEINQLQHLGTYIHPNNKDMYCHYRAPDADSFRAPSRKHDVHFTRAWSAQITPGADIPASVTPLDLVRLLRPEAFAAASDPPPEPMPRAVVAYGSGVATRDLDDLVRTAPARHLMTYRSLGEDRALLVFEHAGVDELRAHLGDFTVHEAIVRLRHLRD